jgi:23S rRNA pseudouridine1911/1915/1917 synthase
MRQGLAGDEIEDGDAGAGWSVIMHGEPIGGEGDGADGGADRQRQARGLGQSVCGRWRSGATFDDEVSNAADDGGEAGDQYDTHDDDSDLEDAELARGEGRCAVVLRRCRVMRIHDGALVQTSGLTMVREAWQRRAVTIGPDEAGARLDRALGAGLADLTRSRIQALIRAGQVTLGGATVREPGRRVKPGERYEMRVPEPEPAAPQAEAMALNIAHEDEHLIVIDKPAGLVVHPAAGHATGTLVNALIAHCGDSLSGIGGVKRPGIVHRLDKDTSGLLVVAKTDAAHVGLSRQFAAHGRDGKLERRYLALVWGVPARRAGSVDAPLARGVRNRIKMAVTRAGAGRQAVTHYEVLERFADADGRALAALLQLELETGRTHQIRVHMAHIGHPVIADPVYATGFAASARRLDDSVRAAAERLGRQALHASRLGFEHPVTGRRLRLESPLPQDMAALHDALVPFANKFAPNRAMRGPKQRPAR